MLDCVVTLSGMFFCCVSVCFFLVMGEMDKLCHSYFLQIKHVLQCKNCSIDRHLYFIHDMVTWALSDCYIASVCLLMADGKD